MYLRDEVHVWNCLYTNKDNKTKVQDLRVMEMSVIKQQEE